MTTILVIILILLLIGALPSWGYSRGWGYYPSGGLGLVLLILIILMLMGRVCSKCSGLSESREGWVQPGHELFGPML